MHASTDQAQMNASNEYPSPYMMVLQLLETKKEISCSPTQSIVRILLLDVGHESARLSVKPFEELASEGEHAHGDVAWVCDDNNIIFGDHMTLGSSCST